LSQQNKQLMTDSEHTYPLFTWQIFPVFTAECAEIFFNVMFEIPLNFVFKNLEKVNKSKPLGNQVTCCELQGH